jgi:hypothetical protein
MPQVPPLRSVIAHSTDFVSGYFLNRLPICPGDTRHYRDARRLLNFFPHINIIAYAIDKSRALGYHTSND